MTISDTLPPATAMPTRAYRAPGSSLVIPLEWWIGAGGSPSDTIVIMGVTLTLTPARP